MIKIDALDTLFFRDGKPFTMGQETWANGLFPPSPSIYYGALRTAYFAHHISELPKAGTPDDPTLQLQIKGVYFGSDERLYLPLPLDMVEDTATGKLIALQPEEKRFPANAKTNMVLAPPGQERVENVEGGLIWIRLFEQYLAGRTDKLTYHKLDDWVTTEPKVGIKRCRTTRASQTGMLYRADMRRLESREKGRLSIYLDVSGLELPPSGLIRLGGEGKIARYEKDNGVTIKEPTLPGKRFKLYLATPAVFENGWLPSWIDEKTLEGEYGGIPLKLVTAAVGKPAPVGGFDMKKRIPKPMYQAVPAGSVYYFEMFEQDEEHTAHVIRLFHGQAISDVWPEQGFGITYVGGVK